MKFLNLLCDHLTIKFHEDADQYIILRKNFDDYVKNMPECDKPEPIPSEIRDGSIDVKKCRYRKFKQLYKKSASDTLILLQLEKEMKKYSAEISKNTYRFYYKYYRKGFDFLTIDQIFVINTILDFFKTIDLISFEDYDQYIRDGKIDGFKTKHVGSIRQTYKHLCQRDQIIVSDLIEKKKQILKQQKSIDVNEYFTFRVTPTDNVINTMMTVYPELYQTDSPQNEDCISSPEQE